MDGPCTIAPLVFLEILLYYRKIALYIPHKKNILHLMNMVSFVFFGTNLIIKNKQQVFLFFYFLKERDVLSIGLVFDVMRSHFIPSAS
jgi:hypothetical protein